jgi:RsiW-degrading membrane proteinase PrsW (M82 family)
MALAPTTTPRVQAYERRKAGVPQRTDRPWWRHLQTAWTPFTLLVLAVGAYCLHYLFTTITTPTEADDGTIVSGVSVDAIRWSASWAALTLAAYSALFVAVDRRRPQRLLAWGLAVFWGGSAACGISLFLNEWASAHMAVMWWAPGYDSARVAVFVAPFVEEAAKATILFGLAFVDRGRIVSRVSGVALAGLSAVGFAFTENILYYAQYLTAAQREIGYGNGRDWVMTNLVWERGVFSSFGHPLFTAMTGLGLAIGLRSRSKLVRVLAPLAGYLAAALCHMSFNSLATVAADIYEVLYYGVLLPALFIVILVTLAALRRQRGLIAARLTDYVMMGWLPPKYPDLFSRWWTRTKALLISPWHGNVIATIRLQNAVTELAYLRDAITRGTVDAGGLWREHELISLIPRLRSRRAIENPSGLRPYFWRRPPERLGWAQPQGLPSGVAANQPVAAGALRYSAVDPRWGPPA